MPDIAESAQPLVLARDLAVDAGGRRIWSHASFDVSPGELVAVLGANGAGKTTLFRLLLGQVLPAEGRLHVLGQPPHRGDSGIGYVPQRRDVDPDSALAAGEYVLLGAIGGRYGPLGRRRLSAGRESARAALAAVDAQALARTPLGALSGGELQRVMLAQALAGQPRLLLLDEPLASLDLRRQAELVRVTAETVVARQLGALLIAHDVNPLLAHLSRVIYVANGRIVTGAVDDVITSEVLSELYEAPVEVLRDRRGRLAVLGIEDAHHHD